jgi:hypothetical protein
VEYQYFATEDEAIAAAGRPRITATRPELILSGSAVTAKTEMDFFGNRAEISNKLSLTSSSGRDMPEIDVGGSDYWLFERSRTFASNVVRTSTPRACGWSAVLNGGYTASIIAFIELFGIKSAGAPVTRFDSRTAHQPECGPCDGPETLKAPNPTSPSYSIGARNDERPGCGSSGDGSGGTGETYCMTVYTDHYWYYPETGRVEYRYTTSEQHCFNDL